MKDKARKQKAVVIGARDDEILLFLGLMGPGVTVEHVAVEFFQSIARARIRIRQLVLAGMIDTWLVDSRASRVLTLTAKGLAHAKAQFAELAPRLYRARPVMALALAHASAVVWSRMYLAALSEAGLLHLGLTPASQNGALCDVQEHRINAILQRPAELVRFVAQHEPEFARFGFARFGLRPDGLAEVALRDQGTGDTGPENPRLLMALEVDRGTEVLATIRSKVERYTRAHGDRALDEVWFFVDGGSQRLKNLARIVEDERGALSCRVVAMETTHARPIVTPESMPAAEGAAGLVYSNTQGRDR